MTHDSEPVELSKRSKVLLCSRELSGLNISSRISSCCPDCVVYLLAEQGKIVSTLLSDQYQLVILDIDALDCAGVTVLPEIRAHFPPEQLPIILLVGPESGDDDMPILDLGATDLIRKPLQTHEVKLRIKNALSLMHCFEVNRQARARLEYEVGSRTKKLNMLIDSGIMMAMEKSRERLFGHILSEGQKLLHCDGATMYLVTQEKTLRFAVRTRHDLLPFDEILLFDAERGKRTIIMFRLMSPITKKRY